MAFQMYINGRLYEIDGDFEPADRSVGIMGSTFIPNSIRDVETGAQFTDGPMEDGGISDATFHAIDEAYHQSLPPEEDDYCPSWWEYDEDELAERHRQWRAYWLNDVRHWAVCVDGKYAFDVTGDDYAQARAAAIDRLHHIASHNIVTVIDRKVNPK